MTIDNPLPLGVTQVSNQAFGFTFGFPTGGTDDPATLAPNDPTVTQVTNALAGSATKVGSLFVDADGNGVVSPGDTLLYKLDFTNTGNSPLNGISAVDTPDPNTTLVVGSVQTSLGTVTSGNTAGDTVVAADIGTIPAGVRGARQLPGHHQQPAAARGDPGVESGIRIQLRLPDRRHRRSQHPGAERPHRDQRGRADGRTDRHAGGHADEYPDQHADGDEDEHLDQARRRRRQRQRRRRPSPPRPRKRRRPVRRS